MYSFQKWASDDFWSVESRAWSKRRPYLWVLQALYLPHRLVCKTGRRLFQSPYGVCTGLHCIRRRNLPKPVGYTYGLMLYWAKIGRTHREPRECMIQLHRRRVISYGIPPTTVSYDSTSLTSWGTSVGLMHAI